MKIENVNHIHAALRAQGITCRSWSISHGYHPRTVLDCIQMFAPCTGRKPIRPLAKQIIVDLSVTINFDLIGGNDE